MRRFLHVVSFFIPLPGYGLARMFDEAFKRVTDLAGVFEANPFVASQICMREVETAMSLPILLAAPEYRSFILAMSTWVGALQACRCGYWDVVEPLVKGACKTAGETRGLWRLSQSFMMFLLEVVPALKEPTADRVAAVASRIRVSKDVHGDEETLWQTFLAECAAGNVPDYIYAPAKQQCDSPCSSYACAPRSFSLPAHHPLPLPRLRVVPVSSVIPSATSKKLEIKDFFSGQVVRGQEEWLPVPLDSQTLAVSGLAPPPLPHIHTRLHAWLRRLCPTRCSVFCNHVGLCVPLLAHSRRKALGAILM
jgi:hypothetical protein